MPSSRLRPLLCGSSVLVFLLLAAQPLAQAQPANARIDEAEAIARALGDPDYLTTSEAARAAASARAETIGVLDNPSVSVTRSRLSGALDEEEEWQAQIVQPIDISGRRNALRAAAKAESFAVIAETSRGLEERKAAARRAYAQCAVAEEIAGVHTTFVNELQSALRIVGERVEAGDTAAYDLRRVRVELSAAEAQAGLAIGEQAATCIALAEITGLEGARSA
ncbi:MAG: TolC family protein, partial [Alphaproteobacteria bacterium]|nr:TolC family protein [Alphaproteobacteria bacterium]